MAVEGPQFRRTGTSRASPHRQWSRSPRPLRPLRDHPLDHWLRQHHLHLRIVLAVCAGALLLGWMTGLHVLTGVAGVATSISVTLVMLYLPRSRGRGAVSMPLKRNLVSRRPLWVRA